MDEELLTPRELADRLKVNLSWIYYHTSYRGESMPHMKIGKHLRFHMSEVMEWATKHGKGNLPGDPSSTD